MKPRPALARMVSKHARDAAFLWLLRFAVCARVGEVRPIALGCCPNPRQGRRQGSARGEPNRASAGR